MSAASIGLEDAEVEGQLVSAQTLRHTLHSSQKDASSEGGSQKKPENSLLKKT